jgi:hypothetical protein
VTREDLVVALLLERFGQPVPEWHGAYGVHPDVEEAIRRRAELEAAVADLPDDEVLE